MAEYPMTACPHCGGKVKYKLISRRFQREGTSVTVRGVRAIVCTKCDEAMFAPDAVQPLLDAANALFALARANQQSKQPVVGSTS